jgi:hypothetical protein
MIRAEAELGAEPFTYAAGTARLLPAPPSF